MAALLLSGAAGTATATAPDPMLVEARAAPDFSRMDLDRRSVSMSALRGKVVLLSFWATWCSPCLEEMPRFVLWQKKYAAQGLQVVAISMDDDEQPVRAAYRKFRLNYPVAMGDEQLGELYGGVLGLPMLFLIDRHGQIRYQHKGAADLAAVQKEIQGLLTKP